MDYRVGEIRVEGVLLGVVITAMWIMFGMSAIALLTIPPFYSTAVTYSLLVFMGIFAIVATIYVLKKV